MGGALASLFALVLRLKRPHSSHQVPSIDLRGMVDQKEVPGHSLVNEFLQFFACFLFFADQAARGPQLAGSSALAIAQVGLRLGPGPALALVACHVVYALSDNVAQRTCRCRVCWVFLPKMEGCPAAQPLHVHAVPPMARVSDGCLIMSSRVGGTGRWPECTRTAAVQQGMRSS